MPLKRKLVRTGKSSYAIILPKDWVEYYGLKEGDYVLLEVNKFIVIKPPTEGE